MHAAYVAASYFPSRFSSAIEKPDPTDIRSMKDNEMTINTLMICGSLRKGSFNRALMNALPPLAPASMTLAEAPPSAAFRSTMPICRQAAAFLPTS